MRFLAIHLKHMLHPGPLKAIFCCILLTLLLGCANESAPTGGKKDETPPVVKKSSPPNESIHFKGNKIELTFNEYIQNNGFAQTIISPPLDKKPAFTVAGKTLTVKLKSPLQPNTTYTINFGDDLKDYNEGNALSNLTYVFSTGEYIDSQSVSGHVNLAKEGTAAEGLIVALYNSGIIDGILNQKPTYFSKTDKQGNYRIKNIKAGFYSIYALKDQNYNYLYDQPNELIAFHDSMVNLTDTIEPRIVLFAFTEVGKRVKLQNVKSIEAGKVMVAYNGEVKKLDVQSEFLADSNFIMWKYPTKDTIIIWGSNYYSKSTYFEFTANDTIVDTARIELKFIDKDSLANNDRNRLYILNQQVGRSADPKSKNNFNVQSLYGSLKINLSRPVVEINASKTPIILEDSTQKTMVPAYELDKKTRQVLEISFDRKENTDYTLEIPDSLFKDVLGLWNKKLSWKFRTNTKDAFGNISLNIKAGDIDKYYIIKLLNTANEVIKQVEATGQKEMKVGVKTIPAGVYHISVIEDANRNGEWDTGNFKLRQQPEKVIPFKDSYTLKGGWDLDIDVRF